MKSEIEGEISYISFGLCNQLPSKVSYPKEMVLTTEFKVTDYDFVIVNRFHICCFNVHMIKL